MKLIKILNEIKINNPEFTNRHLLSYLNNNKKEFAAFSLNNYKFNNNIKNKIRDIKDVNNDYSKPEPFYIHVTNEEAIKYVTNLGLDIYQESKTRYNIGYEYISWNINYSPQYNVKDITIENNGFGWSEVSFKGLKFYTYN